ncbi:MAG: DNA topoisomerase IV subunit A [Alphaproteobacteria bacterium]|nr:DNA topoisomerase IV subunit A [Alphaproteobacteria bacterium]
MSKSKTKTETKAKAKAKAKQSKAKTRAKQAKVETKAKQVKAKTKAKQAKDKTKAKQAKVKQAEAGESTEHIKLRDALESRYLAYALSTITNRALPDARDGLKPVHRRLLYAMYQMNLDPAQGFKKCARVVGDVIGRFHPHGDQSVYDALVRLAQDFAVRYPLVDGQGNFGNVDGDSAAAMRYTEARMTPIARLLLQDIQNDTVDFRATYDNEDEEPIILPAAFPNLLANGASGIAVGMATNIPPHNIGELCSAALHLIKARKARISKLMEYVKGPDFPTGGVIVEPAESIEETYKTGRGTIRLRARYEIEEMERGQWQIVITEIPYQVQKTRLIEKMAELMQAKNLPQLDDIRDESAEDIRLVLVPKSKNLVAEQVMASLFRKTDLETRYSVNLNVLNGQGVPGVLDLRALLLEWLDHRKIVLVRKSKARLAKINIRLEILDGYLIAFLNLNKLIRIIRTKDEPKPVIMKTFKLSEIQAEAILNMRLRALRKLEETAIRDEYKKLKSERKNLKALLASDKLQWQSIATDIKALKKTYHAKEGLGKRRTQFAEIIGEEEAPLDIFIEKEPVTIICSQKGWIRAAKSHIENGKGLKYKTGDAGKFILHAQTTDKLILFATNGRAYTLDIAKLPGGRGLGEPLSLMIDLAAEDSIVEIFTYQEERKLLVASKTGYGFIVPESELLSSRRAGKQVLNVKAPNKAAVCAPVLGDRVAVLGKNKKLLCFPLAELPEMARGKGVRLQNYQKGELAALHTYDSKQGLEMRSQAGRTQTFTVAELKNWQGKRAQAGRIKPKGFPRDGLGLVFPNRL